MKANRAYRLIVTRESHEPAFLGDPGRLDRIEVVAIDDGEVILYWNLPVREASKLARSLRADLARLPAREFIARWAGADTQGTEPFA